MKKYITDGSSKKIPLTIIIANSIFLGILTLLFGFKTLSASGAIKTWDFSQFAFFTCYESGLFFLITLALGIIFTIVPILFNLKKTVYIVIFLIDFLLFFYLAADSFVYPIYRSHLNLAMLQMTFLGGGRIIQFSGPMFVEIFLWIVGLVMLSAITVWLATTTQKFRRVIWVLFLLFVFSFAGANLYHAWGFSKLDTNVISVTEQVPLARPLRINKKLEKWGLIDRKENAAAFVEADGKKMNYPIRELQCTGGNRYNVLFLLVDTLRNDMLNETNMPLTWKFAQENLIFNNHYSNGNNTRHGVFTLFTGLPGSYWKNALANKQSSLLISQLQKEDYKIGIFASAPLDLPEFQATIFSSVHDLRVFPRGKDSVEADKFSVEDFEHWQSSLKKGQKFFGFIFLDSVHAYDFPKPEFEVFKPYWKNVNHMELSNSFDPTEYKNRYMNAVRYADSMIEEVLSYLKEKDLLDSTIVVISSDHGEEFNESKLNYWGHGGNFTDYQIKVPLVVHWPGKAPHVFEYVTSHVDLLPTFLPEVLGCQNAPEDYSVGASLFNNRNRRNWFYADGYTLQSYIEPNQITLINRAGLLELLDRNYHPKKNGVYPDYLSKAMEEKSKFAK